MFYQKENDVVEDTPIDTKKYEKIVTEIEKFIELKKKKPTTVEGFVEKIDLSRTFSPIGTPKMALTKLARWLSQIPVSERAEASAVYTVEAVE